MNSQQILACCLLELCRQDHIDCPQLEEISDAEAQLILKVIASGDFHLDLRQIKCGSNLGEIYPYPVQNSNAYVVDNDDYTALYDLWNAQTK